MHSLAVVELDVSGEAFQLIPVCLHPQQDTKQDSQPEKLYLIGYTDEHKALEKVIYQITPLKDKVCDEYNERIGVTGQSNIPTASVCGYAPYSSIKCQWDDGMALVSNATNGVFTLMGLSIHGPGCTAPARYIALSPYVSWLRLVTGSDADSPQPPQPPQPDQPAYIPAHKLFTSNETRRSSVDFYLIGHDFIPHQKKTEKHNKGGWLKNFYIEPIERDSKTLAIYPIEELFEISPDDCKKRRTLMYREDIFVTVPESRTEITYKLDLYDLKTLFCKCITLKVKCFERSYAYLSFREEFDFVEGTEDLQTIRFEVNKYGSMPIRTAPPGKNAKPKKLIDDQSNYKPTFITFDTKKGTVLSNQLYLRFWFPVTGKLELKMYGAPIDMNPYTLDTTTRAGHTEPEYHDPSYYLGGSIPQMMHRGVADTLVADVHEPVSAGRHLATTPLCVTVLCLLTITLSLNTLLYLR
ncbi:uncharacterized protein LOC124642395 [Helicoverpa zea]|uniref:uncharacterized protein LOC124642395 n=1 Tax=Helicoverpa zea TaxID=7113 RepID=UPI001F59A5B8|nr:uncharacterized protein LOC124642395 [Helicoverpa zea]